MKQYTDLPHVSWICDFFNVQTVTEIYIERNHIVRNEVMQVADLLSCLLAIKTNKQLISTIAKRLAIKISKDFGLIYKQVPFACPVATVSMFWPGSASNDPGIGWLLEKVRDTVKCHLI